jgi:sterol 14alpha-demethylase
MPDQSPRPSPRPRVVSGAKPGAGHSEEFLANPALFMLRAWQECGELAEFDLGGQRNILMVGPAAHEAVFRAPDDQLSAAAPYQYMVPVFGEGIQYGAPLEIERQQVKFLTNALRPEKMKGYARVIAHEVEEWVAGWGDDGEKDFYEEFKELVLRTSTHCLMGSEFRAKLTEEFGALFHDLEQAISPSAVLDAHAQDEVFARRDRARARLQELLMETVRARRRAAGDHPDMLQVFMEARYLDGTTLADELIPGMVVWIMFAGFHTSSNTASWTAVELARHPHLVPAIAREIDAVYRPGADLSFAGLRELPALDGFIAEVLRLHPPLVTLMRRVLRDFEYAGNVFPPGVTLAISPYVSHRVPEVFPDPERFDPTRPPPRNVFASIPFGGGRRKCVGNAFALLQVQSIFCALLARYELELVDPPTSYRDIMPSLILRPSEPCRLRYRRRR